MKKHRSILHKHSKKLILLSLVLIIGIWNVWKPLPSEINKSWEIRNVSSEDVTFIADTTYSTLSGERVKDQAIFDEVITMIREADSYILIDMFLWNDFLGKNTSAHRALAKELAQALLDKKKENPEMVIQVITDPINTSYYGSQSFIFEEMERDGITVTYTNLSPLRDSNPVFSSLWRTFIFPLDTVHNYIVGARYTFRWFPNIINQGGEKVTLRSLLTLLNFKANHRKLIVTDSSKGGTYHFVSLVTSANPHDGSSSHSNVALKVKGSIAQDIIQSERKIVELAGGTFKDPAVLSSEESKGDVSVSLITDKAIQKKVLEVLRATKEGDAVDLLMFYFSDRYILQELVDASLRGVKIRIILDPNKDAFGMKKNGIPNRETADSLVKKSDGNISVRWCDTQGEQCHGKLLIINSDEQYSLILGSANYTRRNIGGYNLETNLFVQGIYPYESWLSAQIYFEELWSNENFVFSTDYETYKDESKFKKIISWVMENTGLGTF